MITERHGRLYFSKTLFQSVPAWYTPPARLTSMSQLSPLKTKASRRTIPVDDLVINEIKAHMERFPEGEHRILITNRLVRPVQRSSFGDCWRRAVENAGLPQGTRFHDLRHFYASVLIAHGLHSKTIQARLGHATMAETMDTYGHLFPDADDHGRGALDSVFGKGQSEAVNEDD